MKISTTDISDLLNVDGGLALNAAVLERLFDEAPDVAFFIKDPQGRYLAVNRSLAERHGFSDKERLIGKTPDEVCPGPFGEVPTEQDSRVLKTGRPMVNYLEMQWLRPHRPCWCLTTKLPLRNASGDSIGLVGFSRDLREAVPLADVPGDLALALDTFEKDCGQSASASSLAKMSGMSASRFARLMKRIFGVTPSQYISRTRINAAARLLRNSKSSIAEVAYACGFGDHSAFTRAFRTAMGLTPTQYRDQAGNR
jgi:PAS domain S-box-containing protein